MTRITRSFVLPAMVLTSLAGAGIGLLAMGEDCDDVLATEFTRIALAFAQHKPDEVDAYFGPTSWRPGPNAARVPVDTLSQRAHHLVTQLDATLAGAAAGSRARAQRLRGEANALATIIDATRVAAHPTPRSFDDEARETYDLILDPQGAASADTASTSAQRSSIDAALAALDRALPRATSAQESLASRFEAYRRRFIVPADRRRDVFDAAMRACRARTREHWTLPANERLDVSWDIAAPAAWHRYAGHGRSMLTITPAALTFIDNAIDLACHEGYPGHHAQFLLADDRDDGVPIEGTVALLRSPLAMLREAAANYAVDLAFPPAERRQFERDTLFPLAGLDPASAADEAEIRRLVSLLEPEIAPILRDYRDGRLTATEASERLERRALVTSPQALLRFVDDLGPYVLGYTIARDRVVSYVAGEMRAGRGDAWTVLATVLKSPDPARVLNSTSSTSSLSAAR
jgi:hypothetical protein